MSAVGLKRQKKKLQIKGRSTEITPVRYTKQKIKGDEPSLRTKSASQQETRRAPLPHRGSRSTGRKGGNRGIVEEIMLCEPNFDKENTPADLCSTSAKDEQIDLL